MIIKKYGITLVRLKEEHIEMLRQKRNLSYIKNSMDNKGEITSSMQKKWFLSINNIYNFYFLIQYKDEFIGLINGKDIDFELRTSEGGIFLWEKVFWNTQIPVIASIIINDFNYLLMNFKVSYAKVLASNKKAIQYNIRLGFELVEERNDGTVWMKQTKENYLKKNKKIRKGISILTREPELLSTEDITFKDDTEENMKQLYSGLPKDIQNLIAKVRKRELREE